MTSTSAPAARPKVFLVATRLRWLALSLGGLVAASLLGVIYLRISHAEHSLPRVALAVVSGALLASGIIFLQLRAEEARLSRELRVARTGTSVTRGMLSRRRETAPALLRFVSSPLGHVALALASNDRDTAVTQLASASPLMSGGGLDTLRAIVEADLHRASDTPAGRRLCITQLQQIAPSGHHEVDLYRTHVLVKAVLEQGDEEAAALLHAPLVTSDDDEMRVYGVWIRAWFELEPEPPIDDGIVRLALLLARSHGAIALVERFEQAFRARPATPREAPAV